METSENQPPRLTEASKLLACRAAAICENRIELFLVEWAEERERILRAFWLGLAAAVCGLLAGMAVTAAVVVACWQWSPVAALLILAAVYGGATVVLCARAARMRRDWESFAASFDELRKDRECFEKNRQ